MFSPHPLKKLASKQELIDFLQSQIAQVRLEAGFVWSDRLKEVGFLPIFQDIDFNEVLVSFKSKIIQYVYTYSMLHGITFNQCKNIPQFNTSSFYQCEFNECHFLGLDNCTFKDSKISGYFDSVSLDRCQFIHCELVNSTFTECILSKIKFSESRVHYNQFERCLLVKVLGLEISDYARNHIAKSNNIVLSPWETIHYDRYYTQQDTDHKSMIVMVYAPEDASAITNKLAIYLQKQNINLVLIRPKIGFNHPALVNGHVHGFILPGGPDVPPMTELDKRTTFEIDIINKAKAHNIPVLGICRGHQLIAQQLFNATIKPVDRHSNSSKTIFINPHSRAHLHINKKYHQFKENKAGQKLPFSKEFGIFRLKGPACRHTQAVELLTKKFKKYVSARAKDNTIEGFEYKNFTLIQHHYEYALADKNDIYGKFARSNIKEFIKQVEYHKVHKRDKHTHTCKL